MVLRTEEILEVHNGDTDGGYVCKVPLCLLDH